MYFLHNGMDVWQLQSQQSTNNQGGRRSQVGPQTPQKNMCIANKSMRQQHVQVDTATHSKPSRKLLAQLKTAGPTSCMQACRCPMWFASLHSNVNDLHAHPCGRGAIMQKTCGTGSTHAFAQLCGSIMQKQQQQVLVCMRGGTRCLGMLS